MSSALSRSETAHDGAEDAHELVRRFGALAPEVAMLANHTRRSLVVTRPHFDRLEEASRSLGSIAPLDADVEDPTTAFRALDEWAIAAGANRMAFAGSFFAHHQLRAEALRARRLIAMGLGQFPELRGNALREYYVGARTERTLWMSALLNRVLRVECPDLSEHDWVVLNVGALTDHEDVDLAIVARTESAREEIARGFGAVSRTFVRYASKIQLFLSEHLESGAVAGLVDEYRGLVEAPDSVVVVMQLLHAEHLAGSAELCERFRREVTLRFRAGSRHRLSHEGFLRSALAELIGARFREPDPESPEMSEDPAEVISPKREIYIPGKLVTACLRMIHDIDEPEPAAALREISRVDASCGTCLDQLASAFEENEALRAMIFAYVVPEDRIDLRDRPVREATASITQLLGLDVSARKSAESRLLAAYREIRSRARQSMEEMVGHVRRYLTRISSLRQLVVRGSELRTKRANVAVRFVAALRRFRGAVFWDELVELLGAVDAAGPGDAVPSDLFARFLSDLDSLGPRRASLIAELVGMMVLEPTSAIEFLAFVARGAAGGSPVVDELLAALAKTIAADPGVGARFAARILDEASGAALYRLALACPPERIGALAKVIERGEPRAVAERAARTVRAALVLAQRHSNQVGRTIQRAVDRSPELFSFLTNPSGLAVLEHKKQAIAVKEASSRAQMAVLGDAFDLSVLRAVLGAILGGSPVEQDAPLIESFEAYARELFKACYREVHARSPMFAPYRPGVGVALFATGGFGRGHAFGADWDYFALVDERDEGQRKFLGKIVQLVEGELARRGVMPHNRLSDTFRAYAVTLPELVQYLRNRSTETFVDEAEILESRFLLGDRNLRRRFEAEVVRLVVTENGVSFVRDVFAEIRGRRAEKLPGLDLKLAPGGLREIHLLGLAASVRAGKVPGVAVPASASFPEPVQRDLRFLAVAEAEIRRVRDLYRLLVASEDYVDVYALTRLSEELPSIGQAQGGQVGNELDKLLEASAERVGRVMEHLERR